MHSEISKTKDELTFLIDLNEVALRPLLEMKNSGNSSSSNILVTKISQMTREKETFSNKKKKLEEIEDDFYTVILKSGAMCLAVNADINTADSEANGFTMLSSENVMEF